MAQNKPPRNVRLSLYQRLTLKRRQRSEAEMQRQVHEPRKVRMPNFKCLERS